MSRLVLPASSPTGHDHAAREHSPRVGRGSLGGYTELVSRGRGRAKAETQVSAPRAAARVCGLAREAAISFGLGGGHRWRGGGCVDGTLEGRMRQDAR